jgi:glutathione S-transferase
MIELYQMEHCPYCAKVRRVVEELNLDILLRSMPKGSPKRELLRNMGGKEQVPFLVDTTNPEQPVMMYESDDIIAYLEQTYGNA